MNAEYLQTKFDAALSYDDYLATGTDEQRRRWTVVYDVARLDERQASLVRSFTRVMNLLVVSGIWCGDCVQQVPIIQRVAEANSAKVRLRVVDRDAHRDLADQVKLCGGHRVPTVIFMAEDFEPCGYVGDRTLSRYRAIAARQLGASCATGIAGPEQDELRATMQDWLDEVERVQLMLRTSARLRQRHGD